MDQTAEIVALKALVNFLLIGVYRDDPALVERLYASLERMKLKAIDELEIKVINLQLAQIVEARV